MSKNYRDFDFTEHKNHILEWASRMLSPNTIYWCAALGGAKKQLNVGEALLDILLGLREMEPDALIWHQADLVKEAVGNLIEVLAYCQTHYEMFTYPQSEILEDIYRKLDMYPLFIQDNIPEDQNTQEEEDTEEYDRYDFGDDKDIQEALRLFNGGDSDD